MTAAVAMEDHWEELYRRKLLIDEGTLAENDFDLQAKGLSCKIIKERYDNTVKARKKKQIELEKAREAYDKHQKSGEKAKTSRSKNAVWEENGDYKTTWYAAPAYMHDLMPSQLEPTRIYRDISHKLRTAITEVDHAELSELWKEFGEAIPNNRADFRRAIQMMRDDAQELTRKSQYTRLKCAIIFSRLMTESDQRKVDQKIEDNKRHGAMQEHAVKATRQQMAKIHKESSTATCLPATGRKNNGPRFSIRSPILI